MNKCQGQYPEEHIQDVLSVVHNDIRAALMGSRSGQGMCDGISLQLILFIMTIFYKCQYFWLFFSCLTHFWGTWGAGKNICSVLAIIKPYGNAQINMQNNSPGNICGEFLLCLPLSRQPPSMMSCTYDYPCFRFCFVRGILKMRRYWTVLLYNCCWNGDGTSKWSFYAWTALCLQGQSSLRVEIFRKMSLQRAVGDGMYTPRWWAACSLKISHKGNNFEEKLW